MKQPARLQKLLDEIVTVDDREMRSDLLIELAERFEEVPAHVACRPFPESHRVPGCESEAFVFTEQSIDGKMKLHFAVENPQGISAKAMAVILYETLSGLKPEEIAVVSEEIVYAIFGTSISMGKGQGLRNMVGMVKALAAAR